MSIYVGKSQNDCGDIFFKKPGENPKSLKDVFNGEIHIWPAKPKDQFLFWFSKTDRPFIENTTGYTDISAERQTITIYIRSCNLRMTERYSYRYELPSWIYDSVSNTQGQRIITGSPSEDIPDDTLRLTILSNASSSQRQGKIKCIQLTTDGEETGLTFEIDVIQAADEPKSLPDYSAATIRFFKNSSLLEECSEYTGAAAIDGSTDVYFTIEGTMLMKSGANKIVRFGDRNNETITVSGNLSIQSGTTYIKKIDSVKKISSNGIIGWSAKVLWNDNNAISDSSVYSFENVICDKSSYSNDGDSASVTWNLMYGGRTPVRRSDFQVKIPANSTEWIGSKTFGAVSMSQIGTGTSVEVTDIVATLVIPTNNDIIDEILYGPAYDNTLKKWKVTFSILPQNKEKTHKIENLTENFSISSETTTADISFKFYEIIQYRPKRNIKVHLTYAGVDSPDVNIQQNAVEQSSTEIVNKDGQYWPIVKTSKYYDFVSTVSTPVYENGYWRSTSTVNTNPKHTSSTPVYTIANLTALKSGEEVSNPWSSSCSDKLYSNGISPSDVWALRFNVMKTTGEYNSTDRSFTLDVWCSSESHTNTNERKQVTITQLGSTDATSNSSEYYDGDSSASVTATNKTDNISLTIKKPGENRYATDHYWIAFVDVNENNSHSSNTVSLGYSGLHGDTKWGDINTYVQGSGDYIDVYVSAYCNVAYTGIERTIDFSVNVGSSSVSLSWVQNAKEYVSSSSFEITNYYGVINKSEFGCSAFVSSTDLSASIDSVTALTSSDSYSNEYTHKIRINFNTFEPYRIYGIEGKLNYNNSDYAFTDNGSINVPIASPECSGTLSGSWKETPDSYAPLITITLTTNRGYEISSTDRVKDISPIHGYNHYYIPTNVKFAQVTGSGLSSVKLEFSTINGEQLTQQITFPENTSENSRVFEIDIQSVGCPKLLIKKIKVTQQGTTPRKPPIVTIDGLENDKIVIDEDNKQPYLVGKGSNQNNWEFSFTSTVNDIYETPTISGSGSWFSITKNETNKTFKLSVPSTTDAYREGTITISNSETRKEYKIIQYGYVLSCTNSGVHIKYGSDNISSTILTGASIVDSNGNVVSPTSVCYYDSSNTKNMSISTKFKNTGGWVNETISLKNNALTPTVDKLNGTTSSVSLTIVITQTQNYTGQGTGRTNRTIEIPCEYPNAPTSWWQAHNSCETYTDHED